MEKFESPDGIDFFMLTPAELYKQGCDEMLGGREPVTEQDWQVMINHWAWRLQSGIEVELVCLVCMIYQVPVSIEKTLQIIQYQQRLKEIERVSRLN